MNGFLKIFRRRSITAILENLANVIEASQRDEKQLLLQYDEIQKRQPPDTVGLDIGTKRLINFMILAFAQQLYLHLGDDDLAGLAKESGEKGVGALNYGGKIECDELITRIRECANSFDKATDIADKLQQRAKLIARKAEFRNDDDAVPVSFSVSTVFAIGDKGVIREAEADLLGGNYWKLPSILSR
jgi:hypothetical protein